VSAYGLLDGVDFGRLVPHLDDGSFHFLHSLFNDFLRQGLDFERRQRRFGFERLCGRSSHFCLVCLVVGVVVVFKEFDLDFEGFYLNVFDS